MNNLDKLWAYIKEKAPPEGIPGDDDREFRDLKQYYEKKVSNWKETEAEKERARSLVDVPLKVCGLTREGCELCQPDTSKKLAVAAKQVPARERPDVYCPTETPKELAVGPICWQCRLSKI